MDRILNDMRICLGKYINFQSADLPRPGVSIVSLKERPLAIGNRLGTEHYGSFPLSELKGGRLDALVRFQLWGKEPDELDREVEGLQGRLLAARDDLRAYGILSLSLEGVTSADHLSSLNAWRKYSDCRVLYEYHYSDTDDAESLINCIAVNIDGHLSIISDDLVRWDSQSAPAMEARRGSTRLSRIAAISILAYLPDGWDGLEVTLTASFNGAKHERTFASLREFFNAFDLVKENEKDKTVKLGGKPYSVGCLSFPNKDFPDPMAFQNSDDTFCISYSAPSIDGDSVFYIRLLSRV